MISKKLEQVRSYPSYRKWHAISYMMIGLGCLLVVISMLLSLLLGKENVVVNILGYAAIVFAILYFLINFLYWRCPKCHKTLPIFGPVPMCGVCKHMFMGKDGKYNW
ncbi:MAG: DUF2614 family zinc ribbon-containing protein [Butyricicoccus sp.]